MSRPDGIDRLAELASILAAGFLRLAEIRRSSAVSGAQEEANCLESGGGESPDVLDGRAS